MTAPWDGQEDQNLAQTLKKAKRKSLIRSIVISLLVTILTLTAIFFGAAKLMERRSAEAHYSEWRYLMISSPNEYPSGFRDNRGFLSGVLEMSTYKIIEGVPVPWNEKWFNYNEWWFPFATGAYGGTTNLQESVPPGNPDSQVFRRQYNPHNGQKEMAYYIPGVEYSGAILNDLNLLTRMEPEELAEMALSFDKPYSFEEVKSMLPREVRPVWYWVDTYDESSWFNLKPHEDGEGVMVNPQPMSSSAGVYGFGTGPNSDEVLPEDFLGMLQTGLQHKDYYSEYKRISRYLTKDKAEPDASDIRILGVVVTGSAAGLKSLNGQPYIRGAVLGAVTDPY
ncbi:hypothetical protein GC101_03145 [Paenibacillus sp. LMG 31459]|uniref:Sigma factor regulator C-terminal domain-containing protein n=1 Tax=Paenibacillus phytohabitans TaxID=2654978 RepID=A0ABX1YDK7_9BACL|nr:anti-sigma factor [Paenibacillus phytohabitans]NOU77869.1 hypothetical protein [Paenibacillus phytohabitans]